MSPAIQDFETAIDIRQRDPGRTGAPNWEPYFWIAFIYATSADDVLWDERSATSYAYTAVQLAPDDDLPRARDVYAEVMFRAGHKDDALKVMRELQAEDPDRAEYYRRREAYFEG